MRKLSAEIGRPVSFALSQHDVDKEQFRHVLALCREANAQGSHIVPQVGSRPTMLLIGHQTFHPFSYRPTYRKLEALPLAERVAKLRDPEIRRRILSEQNEATDPRIAVVMQLIAHGLHKIFPPGEYPVLVIGSGPGGLQLSYGLRKLGVPHAVISQDEGAGGMFRRWPFFQRLLSWTKPYAPAEKDTREYQRYDWNSLIADEPELRSIQAEFLDGTSYFPSRPEMQASLEAFADGVGASCIGFWGCAAPRTAGILSFARSKNPPSCLSQNFSSRSFITASAVCRYFSSAVTSYASSSPAAIWT